MDQPVAVAVGSMVLIFPWFSVDGLALRVDITARFLVLTLLRTNIPSDTLSFFIPVCARTLTGCYAFSVPFAPLARCNAHAVVARSGHAYIFLARSAFSGPRIL